MRWTAGASSESSADTEGIKDKVADAVSPGSKTTGSKRGIVLILAGLVAIGVVAGYHWLKDLPR